MANTCLVIRDERFQNEYETFVGMIFIKRQNQRITHSILHKPSAMLRLRIPQKRKYDIGDLLTERALRSSGFHSTLKTFFAYDMHTKINCISRIHTRLEEDISGIDFHQIT